ncbi:MAG: proton-conducting transporter membrane subunit [Nocardioides sp.]
MAPRRIAGPVTLAAGVVCFAATLILIAGAKDGVVSVGFLRVDALSEVFLLPTGFLYAATAAYSIGYLAFDADSAGRAGGAEQAAFVRYSRLFHVGMNVFAWSMLCAPLADGLALLWIAIEVTTVVSALLVALDNTEGATEAAWKYVLIASCGLGIGLLATIIMYYAGSQALGQSYDLSFGPLVDHAGQLPQTPVRLAFVLAVVGFGTKVGLFPVHTWLPDAHAEAPTPVSALLSGSLLAVSFYAILRYYQVSHLAVGDRFPQTVLLVFGIASLAVAALSLLEQVDLKRLLAYSSVEHMGIIAIGVGFGVRIALLGVFLHVLAHAAAKANAFMGAGVLVHAFQTKSLDGIRSGMDRLPWSGPIFLASILALCAMPPFGLFRSEFQIVAGGVQQHRHLATAFLVVLVTLAFLGLLGAASRIMLAPRADVDELLTDETATSTDLVSAVRAPWARESVSLAEGPTRNLTAPSDSSPNHVGETSWWMVASPLVGLVILVILGVHPPTPLNDLFSAAANTLMGARS